MRGERGKRRGSLLQACGYPAVPSPLSALLPPQMLDVLHMMGRHKHKWDYLREILAENVVYDDMVYRMWMESDSQGLLFASKQGQANMEKPIGEEGQRAGALRGSAGQKGGGERP